MRNNSRPAADPMAGYTAIGAQGFAPSAPAQYGVGQPIPSNTMGDIAQAGFIKINHALSGRAPLAKIVIATQQARL